MTTVISRQQWGAVGPKPMTGRHPDDIVAAVFHYADLDAIADLPHEEAAMRSIQRFHMQTRGWSDIAYNAVVGMSGNVYEGRNNMWVPAHCEGYNRPSIGICFLTDDGISPAAGAAAVEIVQVTEYLLGRKLRIFAHREKRATRCPGNRLMQWVEAVRNPGGPLA